MRTVIFKSCFKDDIREWNEMNFPRSIYIDEKDLEERNVPDFLKSH